MRADPRVLVIGEDVAEGGPWGATAGLAEEFGAERVRNTPISEAAICGIAIGAAQSGLRPVVEIMFIDFVTLALDQLVNQAAKAHFMSGGQLSVPLVLRTQGGAGQRGARAALPEPRGVAHARARPQGGDAEHGRRRRRACSRPRSPTRTRWSSSRTRRSTSAARSSTTRREPVPLGSARVARRGRDVTVVALSRLVAEALAAAEELAAEGIEVEVIDPRTLVPLDLDTIVASVRRTHRLVVAHEAVAHGGFGAEIAAQVQAAAFDQLDAPIERVGRAVRADPVQPSARGRVPAGARRGRRRRSAAPRRSGAANDGRPAPVPRWGVHDDRSPSLVWVRREPPRRRSRRRRGRRPRLRSGRSTPDGVTRSSDPDAAVDGSNLVLSLATAAGRGGAAGARSALRPDAIFADLNTASPELKRELAELVPRFVDVALLGPVPARGLATPVLASGPSADDFARAMAPLGMPVEVVSSGPATPRR